ncbi:MAG: hypothetical protein JWN96_836, partial [Mycobacterium sp.]|nr:hypothetical protein [Mycobacterium sp.]
MSEEADRRADRPTHDQSHHQLVPQAALELLRHGTIEVEGRMVDASNATLYCRITADSEVGEPVTAECVYKPVRGERPLWDFPDGTLAGRELAAYEVSQATGWDLVPPTVMRDGPYGTGMVQIWIDVDESVDLEMLVQTDLPQLRRMALFDAVINNADRKGGHLLPVVGAKHIFGIDHGIAFHSEDKLRTVLWGWRGERFTKAERATLERLRFDADLDERLYELLTRREVTATHRR